MCHRDIERESEEVILQFLQLLWRAICSFLVIRFVLSLFLPETNQLFIVLFKSMPDLNVSELLGFVSMGLLIEAGIREIRRPIRRLSRQGINDILEERVRSLPI